MQNEVAHKTISMMGMFQDSDLFMKLLMLALLFASVWCWAIIIDKVIILRRTRERMKAFEEKFWHAGSLAESYKDMPKKPKDPLSLVFVNAESISGLKTTTSPQHLINNLSSIDYTVPFSISILPQITYRISDPAYDYTIINQLL